MEEHLCGACGFIYDESQAYPEAQAQVAPGRKFEDLPPEWVCPICGAEPDQFITVT